MTAGNLHYLTPAKAGWRYLSARILRLEPGDMVEIHEADLESAVILVRGAITVRAPEVQYTLSRRSPFVQMGDLVYVPPRTTAVVTADAPSEIAIGAAPATGRHPLRLIEPWEMATELRGGGPAHRQITSPLAHPMPAESLIVYEAYVPRGMWAGWPPHRHDGEEGSPYLEETYYFQFDRPSGFGIHRNYTHDGYGEQTVVANGSLVAVPRGYHVSAAAPSANMWILNFLAGTSADRSVSPVFDPNESWIASDWGRGLMPLPAVTPI